MNKQWIAKVLALGEEMICAATASTGSSQASGQDGQSLGATYSEAKIRFVMQLSQLRKFEDWSGWRDVNELLTALDRVHEELSGMPQASLRSKIVQSLLRTTVAEPVLLNLRQVLQEHPVKYQLHGSLRSFLEASLPPAAFVDDVFGDPIQSLANIDRPRSN